MVIFSRQFCYDSVSVHDYVQYVFWFIISGSGVYLV